MCDVAGENASGGVIPETTGGFTKQGCGELEGEARSGDVALANAKRMGSRSPGGGEGVFKVKRRRRGLASGLPSPRQVVLASEIGNCTGNPRVFRCVPVPIPARTRTRDPHGFTRQNESENGQNG